MPKISSFENIENKHDVYRSKDCMRNFYEFLRKDTMKKKKGSICKKKSRKHMLELKEHHKVRDHCHFTGEYRGTAYGISNLNYSIPKGIPLVFHSGSNYDYHFIMKGLPEELNDNLIL